MTKTKTKTTGADAAPTLPAALMRVDVGPPLTPEETIDRLFEVVSGQTAPDVYGFSARERAEAALLKFGRAGKDAIKRAKEYLEEHTTPAPQLDLIGPDDDLEDDLNELCGDLVDDGGNPDLEQETRAHQELDLEPDATIAPVGKTREHRLVELNALSHEELEVIFGKKIATRRSLLICWIMVKEFGSGGGYSLLKNPEVLAAHKLSVAVGRVRACAVPASCVGTEAADLFAEALDSLSLAVAKIQDRCLAQVPTKVVKAPKAPKEPKAPRAPKEKIIVGSFADIAEKFLPAYVGALTAAQSVGLKVESFRRGFAQCRTVAGEQIHVRRGHLVSAGS